MQTDQELLRFNFKQGLSVQINAGKFRFTGGTDSERIGELGVNQSGQLVMTMTKGSFKALNAETGESLDVTPAALMTVPGAGPKAATAGAGKTAMTAALVAGVAGGVGLAFGVKDSLTKSPSK
ncbi:MAG TPA: hypothetical protein VMG30_08060 [Acidobacteriota bacterium]|nr:hypothetical protein [Acidobacteriota bacterium]